jgi:lysozyme
VIRGIDVSHYQGAVNWSTLTRQYGLAFGAAKCTESMSFTDSEFRRNWSGMKAAGLRRIAYHYGRPEAGSPAAQAARLVNAVKSAGGLRPGLDALCLDLEASALSQAATNAWMRAFGDALRKLAPGVTTIVYLGGYAANGSGLHAVDHFDRWWFPRYPWGNGIAKAWPSTYAPHLSGNTTGWSLPHLWQWTPNLAGRDADVSGLSVAELFGPVVTAGSRIPNIPTIPEPEDDPMFLVSVKDHPDQYVGNGVTCRGIAGPTYRAFLVSRGMKHAGPDDAHPVPFEFDSYAGMFAASGLLDPESPRYDASTGTWVDPTPAPALTADAVASAVIAKLPAPGSSLTLDQLATAVRAGVRDVLVGGTAAVPA